MKFDFSQTFKNVNGVVIKEEGTDKDFTLLNLSKIALSTIKTMPNGLPEDVPGEEKAKMYDIQMKLATQGNDADLTLEEAVLIKKQIGKLYPPLYVGPAWKVLDKKEEKPETK